MVLTTTLRYFTDFANLAPAFGEELDEKPSVSELQFLEAWKPGEGALVCKCRPRPPSDSLFPSFLQPVVQCPESGPRLHRPGDPGDAR